MKKLFSKKSGFTLVEIVVAFAVFAIMAAMIAQIISLANSRRVSNIKFGEEIAQQEQTLIAKGKDFNYDTTHGLDGTLNLKFEGITDPMQINYQLKNAEGEAGNPDGINYFVGEMQYFSADGETITTPGGETSTPGGSGSNTGTQTSRFDTRITGTRGINSIVVNVTSAGTNKYDVSVTINDSGVDADYKKHTQCSLFFGTPGPGGALVNVVDVQSSSSCRVQKSGNSGVNIHCNNSTGFGGATVNFTVTLSADIPGGLSASSFGDNVSGGNTYTPYSVTSEGVTTTYVNIFGAYPKEAATSEPTT